MNGERTRKCAAYARERVLRAGNVLRAGYATTRDSHYARALGVLRLIVFAYSLCCFIAFLVSCRVNDVKDCKADELYRSLSQCRTTWTVSPP